nr:PREDICTED: zinc finger and BTB domain-containing protein 20-like [Paralichthys olivaceus]
MEASPCAQVVSSHTASLLMSLNRQRQRAQFCDCVVRQRQSPGQLYPAHRCVLAASSPVLSSLLSSSGALVELQAPCLTGSVLALLLDYIYTGTLPYSRIQQYYYSLLTTACYLQMDELQKALSAWQKTEASVADEANVSTRTEKHVVSEVDKEVQKDQFHVAGTVNAETWQTITEEELERKVEDKRKSSSPCSSLPHPCSAAEETLSQDLRASLPVEMSDTGSDSQGEANDKHSYSSRVPDRMDRQELHCNPYEPRKDWYPTLHKAQTSIYHTVSAQQENDSDNREKRATAAVDNVRGRLFDCERRTSLELSEITEPSFTNQVDSNMSDLMCSVVGQSYHGHLYYHCLPHEDTRLLHRDSDHKPSHPDYSNLSSDEEEEEANTSHRSLRPHFATGTTEQVLLLDISAKPAELLVAYKHKSDEKDIFGSGFREQRDDATSIVGVDKKKSRTAAMVGAESFDEGETKSWVGKTNLERPGDEGIQKAVSNPEEGENQSSTLTACSSPCIPDCVQASISSTLSVCIPATLSASMPRNISAHLSTPLHQPFQCSLCDRSFSQRGSLNRHVRSHLGVRPFPCPCCSMTFSRQYRVTEHMRVHQRCTHRTDFHKPPASSI